MREAGIRNNKEAPTTTLTHSKNHKLEIHSIAPIKETIGLKFPTQLQRQQTIAKIAEHVFTLAQAANIIAKIVQ
ncbi:hypothetical protein KIN20_005032 [Parelaphostrongylus tenuis]|uniref:Uncharacterized protein n=1 Tax=Parelaphostrongylus tenuis TaxID=148309 RepID=A0AAD5M3Y3_PARTN|nr:hypothetical protein KIN20_005032 [Parelaphostrongylus tenuis]